MAPSIALGVVYFHTGPKIVHIVDFCDVNLVVFGQFLICRVGKALQLSRSRSQGVTPGIAPHKACNAKHH